MANTQISRRSFLRITGGVAVAAVVIPHVGPSLFARFFGRLKEKFRVWQNSRAIEKALSTDEGRIALAQSMVEPIRRASDYQAIGRKILFVEPLPQGALPRYDMLSINIRDLATRRFEVAA